MKLIIKNKKYGYLILKMDKEDFYKIKTLNFIIEKDKKGNLICRDKKSRRTLQSIILDLKKGENVKFINNNKLDFRRKNLLYGKKYKPYNKKSILNEIEIKNNTIIVHIYSKKYGHKKVKVDLQDMDIVKKYRWYIAKDNNTFYCRAVKYNKSIIMHRLICNLYNSSKYIVDHKNGNGLDNRRCNLRIVTYEINNKNRQISINNKSGKTGVFKCNNYYYASWFENKKSKQKTFSINKYGETNAKQMAIKFRKIKEKNNEYYNRNKHIIIINHKK